LPDNVIVVDDGSSDLGPQIVKRYTAPFLLQQANEGPASARNKGILRAEETLIASLDADDQWLPQKLQKQVGTL
jgi:glycosyltransferase involved in cell wall biosynthesis